MDTRREIRAFLKVLYSITKLEEQKYRTDQLKFYINKRCNDLVDNKAGVITSILERKRKCIILDRVVIGSGKNQSLITDPLMIDSHINHHFQTVAGGTNGPKVLNDRWSSQYAPIQEFNENWYESVLLPPTDTEWSSAISDLANGKAPGPSGISNEMIKHLGSSMSAALRK